MNRKPHRNVNANIPWALPPLLLRNMPCETDSCISLGVAGHEGLQNLNFRTLPTNRENQILSIWTASSCSHTAWSSRITVDKISAWPVSEVQGSAWNAWGKTGAGIHFPVSESPIRHQYRLLGANNLRPALALHCTKTGIGYFSHGEPR